MRVTQKWRLDEAGEHLAFILQLCVRERSLTCKSDQCMNMFCGDKRTNCDISNVFLNQMFVDERCDLSSRL